MMRDGMDEILAYDAGRPKEEVPRDTERARVLAAPDALAYGLADRVMSRRGPSGTGPGPGPIGAAGPSGGDGAAGPAGPDGAGHPRRGGSFGAVRGPPRAHLRGLAPPRPVDRTPRGTPDGAR